MERGRGRTVTLSNTSNSVNVSKMPRGWTPNLWNSIQNALEQLNSLKAKCEQCKQIGNKHTCYKLKFGKPYPSGYGDINPHCNTDQNLHEAEIFKRVFSQAKI